MKAFCATPTQGYFLRLDVGEEVLTSLTKFLVENNLTGASISGIGAVKHTEIGYFDLPRREYLKKIFDEEMELISFNANFAWSQETPIIHAHATISGPDYLAYSGHLFRAQIAITGEFFVWGNNLHLARREDNRTGLKLISD